MLAFQTKRVVTCWGVPLLGTRLCLPGQRSHDDDYAAARVVPPCASHSEPPLPHACSIPQLCSFLTEVAGGPGYIICNSVGGLAGLEAAIARPDLVKGVQLINISLRHAHNARTGYHGFIHFQTTTWQRLTSYVASRSVFRTDLCTCMTVQ